MYDGLAELAEMLRRVMLVGFFVLFQPRGSIIQLIAGTTFSAIFLVRAGNLKWCHAHGVYSLPAGNNLSSWQFVQMQAGPYLELPEDYLANSCSTVFCVEPMQRDRRSGRSK
jgi:hypothetical protein